MRLRHGTLYNDLIILPKEKGLVKYIFQKYLTSPKRNFYLFFTDFSDQFFGNSTKEILIFKTNETNGFLYTLHQ